MTISFLLASTCFPFKLASKLLYARSIGSIISDQLLLKDSVLAEQLVDANSKLRNLFGQLFYHFNPRVNITHQFELFCQLLVLEHQVFILFQNLFRLALQAFKIV